MRHSVEIDGETLPWIERALVEFTVISADGTQLYPGRDAIPISQMVGPSYSLTIAPGQSVQGDMEFGPGRAPLYATLAKGDLLLLWGARIRRYGTPPGIGDGIMISGGHVRPKKLVCGKRHMHSCGRAVNKGRRQGFRVANDGRQAMLKSPPFS